VVTFAELHEAAITAVGGAAEAWDQLAGKTRTLQQRVGTELTGVLRTFGWAGMAADAAFQRLTWLREELELDALQQTNLAVMLRAAAKEFDRIQRNLHAAIDAAHILGLTVHSDGTVSAAGMSPIEHHDPDAYAEHQLAQQNAGIYTDPIRKIVADATDIDLQYANALRKFNPDDNRGIDPWSWNHANQSARDAATLLGLSGNAIPAGGSDPKTVAAWWQTLDVDQRQIMLTAYPDRLGGLDGLPTVDRDQANRLQLRDLIGEDANHYGDPPDPQQQRLAKLLGRLESADFGPAETHLYLLGLSNQGDGQAIVAVGNPDTARHTTVLVPGVSTNLDGMNGVVSRAVRIQGAASQLDMGSVAVVAWLGYDPPQMDETVVTAAGSHRAEAGAVSLDNFANGLRVTHDAGPRSHHRPWAQLRLDGCRRGRQPRPAPRR
jgi:hypothetical protein